MNTDDTTTLISGLAADTVRLIAATEAETAALRVGDIAAFGELASAKSAAAGAWEKRVRAFGGIAGGLAALSPEQRRAVRELGERLVPVTDANARLLSIAVDAGRRTMASVAEAAKSLAPGPSVYGRDGSHAGRTHHGAPTGVAVSFNQSL